MNQGYNEVFGGISGLRAASDNLRMIDDMITNLSGDMANTQLTADEQLQCHLGLVEQLADMIVARHAYRSNNRVLGATDALLDKLY